jgi:Protein of unknown function (DUF3489)
LTDRQLVALSKAAQRDDRALAAPQTLTGKALSAFANSLPRRGLAAEVRVRCGQPVWRRNEAAGQNLTMVMTDRGLAALGIDTAGDRVATTMSARGREAWEESSVNSPIRGANQPRPASKQTRLIAMLSSADGCSIDEAAVAFGWLPHTTRAVLTGLRRKGHRIERVRCEAGAPSRHRIVESPIA